MLWRFATIIFFSVLLTLYGCTNKKTSYRAKKTEIIVAQKKTLITALHFSGTLSPLYSYAVLSPTDARVTAVLFTYGQQITKGQTLIKIDATKIAEDYRKGVSDYLEKKQSYENGLISFQGTEALYKAGVISKDEYLTARSRQNSDTLSYFQSKYAMEKLLPAANISVEQIESLNLSDIDKVNAILNAKFHLTEITAPANGVALFPTAEEKKDATSSGRINVGDELKSGQRILSIGDLTGLSMNIKVNEINVNSIKPNQEAIVTGDAFPGITLKGRVESVASQATPMEGESGLSTFAVVIKIPHITPQEQSVIHVGMSAQAELDVPQNPVIMLPITAVFEKNSQKMVTILDTNGKPQDVPVVTGQTTLTEVAIAQGVAPGDRVVVNH